MMMNIRVAVGVLAKFDEFSTPIVSSITPMHALKTNSQTTVSRNLGRAHNAGTVSPQFPIYDLPHNLI